MRYLYLLFIVSLVWAQEACRHTKPGTYVEVIEKDGTQIYMSGAVAPGISQSKACPNAVKRAVAAAALRFSQDFRDLGDEIAQEVGASDGEPLLNRYAKSKLIDVSSGTRKT